MIASLFLSFCRYDVLTTLEWIGLRNYKEIFNSDLFWKALYNTLYWVVIGVPLRQLMALILALLNNQQIRGKPLFRTIFYIPSVVSGVALAMLWVWLFEPSVGLINTLLRFLGVNNPPLWLGSEEWSKPALIIMSLWGVGQGMVIYLAGLQDIPQQLYEAAEIDGAGIWHKFWKITIPLLTPSIFFNFIMGVIGSFQVFTQAYVMTRGGPLYSTYFYVLYIYDEGFQYMHMGYASALAWILFLIILFFTLLQLKSSGRWVVYERL
ncbi:sugar ABC transporter permease [bacterium]|nr:sugar ABC transporter permease [bacterium]